MQRLLSAQGTCGGILDLIRDIAAVRRLGVVCCALMLMGGVVRAQNDNLTDQDRVPAPSPAKDNDATPPGACKPIGLTVSGEVVFPFECKEFIEQRILNSKPAVVVTKPSSPEPNGSTPDLKASAVEAKPAAADVRSPSAAQERPAEPVRPANPEERPASTEAKSAGGKPVEPKPADPKPAEPKSAETRPVESRSVEIKPAKTKSVATKPIETKPAAEPQTVEPLEEAAPDNGQASTGAIEAVPLPKRADRRPREQASSAPANPSAQGCMHFRSYDPAAGTYRTFDGKIRPCR
jgi:hypothetical protein